MTTEEFRAAVEAELREATGLEWMVTKRNEKHFDVQYVFSVPEHRPIASGCLDTEKLPDVKTFAESIANHWYAHNRALGVL